MKNLLPKHISQSILSNQTSLGEHPSFPPDEEEKFILYVIEDFYKQLSEVIIEDNEEKLTNLMTNLLLKIKEIEKNIIPTLEELCIGYVTTLFDIPVDTLNINSKIVNNIDTSMQRLLPEKTSDFSFDSIEDMKNLTDEVYKRRMLNALITGAAMFYANNIDYYVQDLFKINYDLPSLYKNILLINSKLLYIKNINNLNNNTDGGKVDVMLSFEDNPVIINSEGIILPILIEETIKGVLELAISHGLPKNKEKAEYVIKKSDFKLAEIWDMRMGLPLWEIINNHINDLGFDIREVGLSYFFMYLAEEDLYNFNINLQEIFRGTKKGKKYLEEVLNNIINNKEEDDFNEYIEQQHIVDDEGCYNSEELLSDSVI